MLSNRLIKWMIVLFCLSAECVLAKTIEFSESTSIDLLSFAEYLEAEGNVTVDDVLNTPKKWKENIKFSPDLESKTYWFRFDLRSISKLEKTFFISIKPSFIEESTLYDSVGNELDKVGSMVKSKGFNFEQTLFATKDDLLMGLIYLELKVELIFLS